DRINKHLSKIEVDLLDVWRDHKPATYEELTALVKKEVKGDARVEKKTFSEAVRRSVAQYEQEKEKTTAGRYKVLLNKLIAFNPNLTFEQIDHNFYDAFKKWLYGNDNQVYTGYDLRRDPDSDGYILVACDSPSTRVG